MTPVLINGRAYDFSQVLVTILGVPIYSVSAVSYTETQEKENSFGSGIRPVSRGHGAINAEASIDISMNDTEALRAVAPNGSLLQIPAFDIAVTFLNTENIVVNHILKNAEFTDDGVEGTVGDKDLKRTFALVISHVKYL